jgi:hypothetical protein
MMQSQTLFRGRSQDKLKYAYDHWINVKASHVQIYWVRALNTTHLLDKFLSCKSSIKNMQKSYPSCCRTYLLVFIKEAKFISSFFWSGLSIRIQLNLPYSSPCPFALPFPTTCFYLSCVFWLALVIEVRRYFWFFISVGSIVILAPWSDTHNS